GVSRGIAGPRSLKWGCVRTVDSVFSGVDHVLAGRVGTNLLRLDLREADPDAYADSLTTARRQAELLAEPSTTPARNTVTSGRVSPALHNVVLGTYRLIAVQGAKTKKSRTRLVVRGQGLLIGLAPEAFEAWVGERFRELGYDVQLTRFQGD